LAKGTKAVEVTFADDDYRSLEQDAEAKTRLGQNVVRAYRKLMRIIRDATDERDLRAMNSLRFKRLEGDRSHEHSLRLNDQWRLIVEIREATPKNVIHVIKVEDYH